jgi:hypothetical protein
VTDTKSSANALQQEQDPPGWSHFHWDPASLTISSLHLTVSQLSDNWHHGLRPSDGQSMKRSVTPNTSANFSSSFRSRSADR